MAEDTCRNGLHPADDVYVYPSGKKQCRSCKREATYRYLRSPKGRIAAKRAQRKYNHSLKGFLYGRDYYLKHRRAEILRELAELEEEECQAG